MDGLRTRMCRRREDGVAAVEFALVMPLLVMLIFGIIEFSLALRDHTVVTSNARTAARVAATGAGAGPGTCFTGPEEPPCTPASTPALAQEAADAIQRSGTAMPEDYIDFLLVYKANSDGYPGAEGNTTMPDDCSAVENCVMFTWRASANAFRYSGGIWTSTSINACFPGTPTAPQDRVGVYLQAQHPFTTGLFGDGLTLSERAVMDFEPLPTNMCRATEHL
jgi:hypothetical protein